ncbi:MAG: hypothetical protein GZ089_00150 [Aromatoleum sp.]|nr:hypothetical protein [Aromatoleum sp.]
MRRAPSDAVLDELAKARILHPARDAVDRASAIVDADRALEGRFVTEDGTSVAFSWPFDAADLEQGPLDWSLAVAAFAIPDRLLKAYDATGELRYLDQAVEYVLAWQRFEASAWLPRGLMWNDHAIAERVYVLVDLWRSYRKHPRFDPERAKLLLVQAERCAIYLARPDHFTSATNHGVMQNLALMLVAIAMPGLPDAKRFFDVGRERFIRQLDFYVSRDGVVLEHSAGYHEFGLQLLRLARRYFELAGVAPPAGYDAMLERASHFLDAMRRPDGSLPLIGDTRATSRAAPATIRPGTSGETTAETPPERLTPAGRCLMSAVAGYSVWRTPLDGSPDTADQSQLVTLWSHFPGHGHKHADELSILLWADGQDWIANAGYWAYGDPDRGKAESWDGSNAPHLLGESPKAERSSELMGSSCSGQSAAIDLQRVTREGLRIRRQVVQISPVVWIVIDHAQGGTRTLVTNWTGFPGIDLENGPIRQSFRMKRATNGMVLDFAYAGSDAPALRPLRGSSDPFAGWVFMDHGPAAAPALRVEQAAGESWSAMIWVLNRTPSVFGVTEAPAVRWGGVETWSLSVGLPGGRVAIVRDHATITIGTTPPLQLMPPAVDVSAEQAKIAIAYAALKADFPIYRDLGRYRRRAAVAAIGLFALQVFILYTSSRRFRAVGRLMNWVTFIGWILVCVWLQMYYFAH